MTKRESNSFLIGAVAVLLVTPPPPPPPQVGIPFKRGGGFLLVRSQLWYKGKVKCCFRREQEISTQYHDKLNHESQADHKRNQHHDKLNHDNLHSKDNQHHDKPNHHFKHHKDNQHHDKLYHGEKHTDVSRQLRI